MTREDREKAIEILSADSIASYSVNEILSARDLAVEALKQMTTPKNYLGVDCIDRAEVLKLMQDNWHTHNGDWAMQESMDDIRALPSVTPQEPRCKDCKWWKDSDGVYRRGCRTESKCPINRREVFEGNGYCYLFEPQESEEVHGNI